MMGIWGIGIEMGGYIGKLGMFCIGLGGEGEG